MRSRTDPAPPTAVEGPVRTCVGCRRRVGAAELFRVVVASKPGPDPLRLVVDTRRRLPGRGAWVHPDAQCVDQAIRRRAFARALRVTGNLDPTGVTEALGSAVAPAAQQ